MTDLDDKDELPDAPESDTPLEQDNAEQAGAPLTARDWLALACPVVGGLLCLYSMYLILYGADYIAVNRFSGPSLWQLIQLNPSIITMFGAAIIMLGRVVRGK